MSRIRYVKPGFFKNEDLCALSFAHRLCFEGLWVEADREGRLEDRPKRLKVEIFPYDDVDIERMLADLAAAGFIRRYTVDGNRYIAIPSWHKHQRPRNDEATSVLPPAPPDTEQLPTHIAAVTDPSPSRDDATSAPSQIPEENAAVTDPSLSSDEPATAQRMGSGEGEWETGMGNGEGKRTLAETSRRRPMSLIQPRRRDAAFEGPRGLYVPERLHNQFVKLRNHTAAEEELLAWYAGVCDTWAYGARKANNPDPDMFKFWKACYAERWPPTESAGQRHSRTVGNRAALTTFAKRGHRA